MTRQTREAGDRMLVVGGAGMLGLSVVTELERRGIRCDAPDRDRLDLATGDPGARVDELEPRAVINASAFTDVNAAERPEHRERVDRLNRDAPGELARACHRHRIPLLHVSTDYVFDGTKTEPYREDDEPRPLQVYGLSKLEGERAVLSAHPDALVVRTSTLFGPRRDSRLHYVDAILRQARAGGALSVVRLPVSSPTYCPDLARGLVQLLLTGARGLIHLVNRDSCSRLELAREAVRAAGLAGEVEVRERPAPAGELRRPAYSVLDTARFRGLTGAHLRSWREALSEYVTSLD